MASQPRLKASSSIVCWELLKQLLHLPTQDCSINVLGSRILVTALLEAVNLTLAEKRMVLKMPEIGFGSL
jgi:hypothetical protein